MGLMVSSAKNRAPNVMLHPQDAIDLRARSYPIDANVAGFISWGRLVDALRASGEIPEVEEVEAFVLTDRGIHFYVRSRR